MRHFELRHGRENDEFSLLVPESDGSLCGVQLVISEKEQQVLIELLESRVRDLHPAIRRSRVASVTDELKRGLEDTERCLASGFSGMLPLGPQRANLLGKVSLHVLDLAASHVHFDYLKNGAGNLLRVDPQVPAKRASHVRKEFFPFSFP